MLNAKSSLEASKMKFAPKIQAIDPKHKVRIGGTLVPSTKALQSKQHRDVNQIGYVNAT